MTCSHAQGEWLQTQECEGESYKVTVGGRERRRGDQTCWHRIHVHVGKSGKSKGGEEGVADTDGKDWGGPWEEEGSVRYRC